MFYALLFLSFLCLSYQNVIEPCLTAQICRNINSGSSSNVKEVKCSEHGKCFYDLDSYIRTNNLSDPDFINCICDSGYSNLKGSNEVKCCYKQKEQYNAFVLELIPGFGAGHFYSGNYLLAWIKFGIIFALLVCVIVCFCLLKGITRKKAIESKYINNNVNEVIGMSTKEMILNGIIIMCLFFYLAWQVIDAILYGLNFYNDENNVKLNTW